MKKTIYILLCMLISSTAMADEFKLSSTQVKNATLMSKAQEYNGFGCTGNNTSPRLSWTGAPAATKSFALTVYDPDAPTGSGWWHWQIININKHTTELQENAGNIEKHIAPKDSLQIENDYGAAGFGGACPPAGSKAHRYQFTLYALSVDKLNLAQNASGALVGYMIKSHALASTSIEALYKRQRSSD